MDNEEKKEENREAHNLEKMEAARALEREKVVVDNMYLACILHQVSHF